MLRARYVLFLIVLFPLLAFSQAADPSTVTFTLDFPGSQPEHYFISIQSGGAARYESSGKVAADSDDTDSFGLDFTASTELREKVFALAAKAGYFQKDLDAHHKNIAFTGKKILTYKDAKRQGESTYNYAAQPAAQELTSLLQSLSATLEFGRRLHYDHRYQKLAIDQELKRMEEENRITALVEVSAIAPILHQIIDDPSVMNVSRARAQRLLAAAR